MVQRWGYLVFQSFGYWVATSPCWRLPRAAPCHPEAHRTTQKDGIRTEAGRAHATVDSRSASSVVGHASSGRPTRYGWRGAAPQPPAGPTIESQALMEWETQAEMNDFPWNVLLGLATCLCSDRDYENEPSEQGPMPDAGPPHDRPRGLIDCVTGVITFTLIALSPIG